MLPFNKRNARTDEVEDLHTGDILEAVRSSRRARAQARPEVFEHLRHQDNDEVTVMMPSKRTLPPPPSGRAGLVVPSPLPYAATVRQDGPMFPQDFPQQEEAGFEAEEPQVPVHNGGRTHIIAPVTVARSYVEPVQQPAYAFPYNGPASSVQAGPASVAPVAMSIPTPHAEPSDPRFEVPATVITTRTKVLTGRPTVSWAAALVAMGVFAGLVTAVIARGDGDSMLDATAAFADSHGVKIGSAAAARPAAPSPVVVSKAPAAQPVAAAAAPQRPGTPTIASPAPVPPPGVIPAAPALAPALQTGPVLGDIARATDAAKKIASTPAVNAYARPQEPKAEPPKVETKEEPKKPAPPPRVVTAPRPAGDKVASKGSGKTPKPNSELANAEEAKKLADQQLEAALR